MHLHALASARSPWALHKTARRVVPRKSLKRNNSFDLEQTELGKHGAYDHMEGDSDSDGQELGGGTSIPLQGHASVPLLSPRLSLDSHAHAVSANFHRAHRQTSGSVVPQLEHMPQPGWNTNDRVGRNATAAKSPPGWRERATMKSNKMMSACAAGSSVTQSWLEAPVTDKELVKRRLVAPQELNKQSAMSANLLKMQEGPVCRHCPHCKQLLVMDLSACAQDPTRVAHAAQTSARSAHSTRAPSSTLPGSTSLPSPGRRHSDVSDQGMIRESRQHEFVHEERSLELEWQPEQDNNAEDPTYSPARVKFRILCLLGFVWLVCGLAFFMWEGYNMIDAAYSMAQILTTVGYGDVVPEKPYQKLITCFIVLSSTLLMAGFVSQLIDFFLDSQAEMLAKNMHAKEAQIKAGKTSDRNAADEEDKRLSKMKFQCFVQTAIFVAFITTGTLFYALVEPCSCSYGKTRIPGCEPDNCYEKGEVKTFVDAFYLSVITITTVGYGDITPQSQLGRIFGTFWMLFGVGSIVNLVGTVTDFLNEMVQVDERMKMTQDMFHKMDRDGDGQLDKYEFLRLQMVMLGLATEDELESIDTQFHLIDLSGDGNISLKEFRTFYM